MAISAVNLCGSASIRRNFISLIRDAIPGPLAKRSIDVERVTGTVAMEEFLDAYIAGWQIPVNHDGLRRNVRPWLVQSGWSLFLARVEGKPAATAILYVESGAGYLADASCDPIYRRRGLHAALLERRIGESSAAGVGLICSGAAFLSASHRNMERAGMRIQFNRSIWTERA
jgi:ribosomal protein S18 acetylase RimI-like enzyme